MVQQGKRLDTQYMELLSDVEVRYVFVMGDHRTGTTILYKLLGATGCFNIVTVYHIVNYHELLYNHINQLTDKRKQKLSDLFVHKGISDRVIDGVKVSPDMPEEYGFVFEKGGQRPGLRPHNAAQLIELSRKVQFISDPDKPLLLKNPWDYFLNFMYVKEVFPNSKFIFLHRNPIRTINSQLSATRSMFSARNEYIALIAEWYDRLFQQPIRLQAARLLFSSRLGLGLRLVTRHTALATDYYLKYISSLPLEDYISVRYEDLCIAPEQTIHKILSFFDLEADPDLKYDALIEERRSELLPEVADKQQSIFKRMKPYFEHFGYVVDGVSLGSSM